MNDEELISRVRRTFRDRADGVQPSPGRLPTGDPAPTGRTAFPPPAPVPPVGRTHRRWPPVVGIGVVAAAAAASIAVAVSGGSHHVTVRPVNNAPVSVPPPRTTVSQNTSSNTVATTVAPPSTAPPAVRPVAAGFRPQSVTFVSPDDGWVIGSAPGACTTMARTIDGGRTWSQSGAPSLEGGCATSGDAGTYRFEVRFADANDGWVYPIVGPNSLRSVLWSTHDGGTTWRQQVPLPGGVIGALEASGGRVQIVVSGPCPPGSAGCDGQTVERILTAPVGTDSWQTAPLSPSIGAGPVLSPALTLWGGAGWLINVNRTVVSGGSLSASRGWTAWTPPCAHAGGPGLLAAASASDLVAVCAEGMWGTPDAGTTAGRNWLYRSTDGGRSFAAVGPIPGNQPLALTTAPGTPGTVVLADGGVGLQATFDGGSTWSAMEPGVGAKGAATGGYVFDYVGFTTSTQGVAVATLPAPAVFMTRDGGHTWSQVRL